MKFPATFWREIRKNIHPWCEVELIALQPPTQLSVNPLGFLGKFAAEKGKKLGPTTPQTASPPKFMQPHQELASILFRDVYSSGISHQKVKGNFMKIG